MNKLTTTHKIAIAGVVVTLAVGIAAIYSTRPTIQQDDNSGVILNQNENQGTIANNINQIGSFVLTDKEVVFQDNEHQAAMVFQLDGKVLPPKTCFTIESDARILEINVEGSATNPRTEFSAKGAINVGVLCLDNPRSEMMLWTKFDKQPTKLDGFSHNI